ncbi:hypothetical protein D3C71_1149740 [compost metagenome]
MRIGKKSHGGHVHARIGDHIPGRRQPDRGELLAHALGPGVVAAHEHRHVRAQLQAQRGEGIHAQPGLPQGVQAYQHGRRIRRAAPEATAGRNGLFNADVSTFGDIRFLFKQHRRAHRQVVGLLHTGHRRALAADLAVAPHAQTDPIAPLEQAEHGLQLVVPVGPTPGDMQEQVELGRGRPL